MPAPFNQSRYEVLRKELWNLYIIKNLSLSKIAKKLRLSESGVYRRLLILRIPIRPSKKTGFLNMKIVDIPSYSANLAEFIGIMLGDGHISPTQIYVTSHRFDDLDFHKYVRALIQKLFKVRTRSMMDKKDNIIDCYVGSVRIVRFLKKMGLVENKVKKQVAIPSWIFQKRAFQFACLRGLIDTDGSVYRLKSGSIQISFKNFSYPLLYGVRNIFRINGFHPSKISSNSVYLTRKDEIERYFKEISTSNPKHLDKYLKHKGGSHSGNCIAL